MKTKELSARVAKLEDELRRLCDYIDECDVRQSTKNANAGFIDMRAWFGLKSLSIETRKQLTTATRARKTNEWQKIETCPKAENGQYSGPRFLAWSPEYSMTFPLKHSPNRPAPHFTTDAGAVIDIQPTHWMHLPDPPASARK